MKATHCLSHESTGRPFIAVCLATLCKSFMHSCSSTTWHRSSAADTVQPNCRYWFLWNQVMPRATKGTTSASCLTWWRSYQEQQLSWSSSRRTQGLWKSCMTASRTQRLCWCRRAYLWGMCMTPRQDCCCKTHMCYRGISYIFFQITWTHGLS